MKFVFMTIGIPGSGKSTWANEFARLNPEFKIVSSDKIREELYGDESIQGNPKDVFKIAFKRTAKILQHDNARVIFDATNVQRKYREQFIDYMKKGVEDAENIYFTAVFFDCPYQKAIERQNERSRKVPNNVIYKMHSKLEPPTKEEGWDWILRKGE